MAGSGIQSRGLSAGNGKNKAGSGGGAEAALWQCGSDGKMWPDISWQALPLPRYIYICIIYCYIQYINICKEVFVYNIYIYTIYL